MMESFERHGSHPPECRDAESDRVELPLGSSGDVTPATEADRAADPGALGDLAAPLRGEAPWHGGLGPLGQGRTAALASGAGVGGTAPATQDGRERGQWRHLQQLSRHDGDVLSPAEVLEFLLYFGGSGARAAALAEQLLDRFGSLGAVVTATPTKLAEVLGGDDLSTTLLKVVRTAVQAIVREPLEERPVIGSASALMEYLSVTMRHEATEATRILFLDRKNALIKDEILHRGTVDHTPLYPREVLKRVIELGASAIILVHNHPSGDPTPSQSDVEMTRQLAAALGTINVVLHDHVIVGRNKEASLRKLGLL
jgi:DNA repair protein RadC